jgi:hypothetical protein
VEAPLDASIAKDRPGIVYEVLTHQGARIAAAMTQHEDEDEVLLPRRGQYVVTEVLHRVPFERSDGTIVRRTVVRVVER